MTVYLLFVLQICDESLVEMPRNIFHCSMASHNAQTSDRESTIHDNMVALSVDVESDTESANYDSQPTGKM